MKSFEEFVEDLDEAKTNKKKKAVKPKDKQKLGDKKAPVERAPHHAFGS